MTKHLCQGPECHTHKTQSRIRGVKGAKVLRTRNAYAEINGNPDSWANPNNWSVYFLLIKLNKLIYNIGVVAEWLKR